METVREALNHDQVIAKLLADPTMYGDFEALFVRPAPMVVLLFQAEVIDSFMNCSEPGAWLWL
jgi:hypothetical protein